MSMVADIGRVEWDTSLETGIDVVDEQHRQYFVLLNNYLEKASEAPHDGDEFFPRRAGLGRPVGQPLG